MLFSLLLLIAQQAQPGPSVPADIFSVSSCNLTLDENFRGIVDVNTGEKTVVVTWTHYPIPNSAVGRTQVTATYNTVYFPTAITPGGPGVLYVGGTRPINGKTVIERWTFDVPTASPAQAEVCDRLSVQTILNTSAAGRTHIVGLARPVGLDGVFALHYDSRDLWLYRETTSTWSLAASPTGSGGLHVPHLDDHVWRIGSRSHVSLGGTYSFGADESEHVLILHDADKDGILDSQHWLTGPAWSAAGYGNPASYD